MIDPVGYWYLATPYAKYQKGTAAAYRDALEQTALLLRNEVSVYSPIVHNHKMFGMVGRGHDYSFWIDVVDGPLMRGAYGLIICTLEGWEHSEGVKREIAYFEWSGKPRVWMTPGECPWFGKE